MALAGCTGMLGSDGTTTLRVINSAYGPVQNELEEMFTEFEDEHGVEIEYERSDFAEAPQQASQAHAAGDPFDVMTLASPANNIGAVQEGLVQPINELIDDRGADYWNEDALFQIDGEYYFAPDHGSALNLITRNDILDEVGAPQPPFDTWDEYITAAELATDEDENRYGHPVFLGNNHFHPVWVMSLVLGNGGNLVNTDGDIVFDSEEVVETLEFIDELDEYSDESAHNSDIPGMRPPVYQGQYAMSWYSTNLVPYDIEEYNPDLEVTEDVALSPIPTRTEDRDPIVRMTGVGYGVSSETDNPDLALDLVRELTSHEGVVRQLLAHPGTIVPMVDGILDEDELWEDEFFDDENNEEHYRNLVNMTQDYGRFIAVEENEGHLDPTTGQAITESHVVSAAQDVVLDDVDPQQAAEDAAEEMREEYL